MERNELKILIIGRPRSGKTTLAQYIAAALRALGLNVDPQITEKLIGNDRVEERVPVISAEELTSRILYLAKIGTKITIETRQGARRHDFAGRAE